MRRCVDRIHREVFSILAVGVLPGVEVAAHARLVGLVAIARLTFAVQRVVVGFVGGTGNGGPVHLDGFPAKVARFPGDYVQSEPAAFRHLVITALDVDPPHVSRCVRRVLNRQSDDRRQDYEQGHGHEPEWFQNIDNRMHTVRPPQ